MMVTQTALELRKERYLSTVHTAASFMTISFSDVLFLSCIKRLLLRTCLSFIPHRCLARDWLIWLNPTLCTDRREKGEKRLIGQEKNSWAGQVRFSAAEKSRRQRNLAE